MFTCRLEEKNLSRRIVCKICYHGDRLGFLQESALGSPASGRWCLPSYPGSPSETSWQRPRKIQTTGFREEPLTRSIFRSHI